jgi:hypothetical protein
MNVITTYQDGKYHIILKEKNSRKAIKFFNDVVKFAGGNTRKDITILDNGRKYGSITTNNLIKLEKN